MGTLIIARSREVSHWLIATPAHPPAAPTDRECFHILGLNEIYHKAAGTNNWTPMPFGQQPDRREQLCDELVREIEEQLRLPVDSRDFAETREIIRALRER